MASRHDPVRWFESSFSIALKRQSGDEYAGPCPWCGGEDRFRVWRDKQNFMCRPGVGHCGKSGFLDDLTGESDVWQKLSEIELKQLEQARRQDEIERRQAEQDRRLSALERMARCTDHVAYHRALIDNDAAFEYWLSEGMNPDTIAKYQLGYCPRCPTASNGSPSYTIPVINNGALVNIRHRLVEPCGGKYRPHMAGLGSQLFNEDNLRRARESIVITEGEKKSMVLDQTGIQSVGILGSRNFKSSWFDLFNPIETVYVALDPDAIDSAERLAAFFGDRGRVVILPEKADDMIAKRDATKEDMLHFIRLARPVNGRTH